MNNFLQFILNRKEDIPEPISVGDIEVDKLIILAGSVGAVLVYGSGVEMSWFYKRVESKFRKRADLVLRKFFLTSGDIQNINNALPLDSKRVISGAFKVLALSRYDSKRVQLILFILRLLNPFIFWLYPFIFRKQFCFIFSLRRENLYSFLSEKTNVTLRQLAFSIYKSPGKFVLPLFDIETGENIGYAKIYDSREKSQYYGENEVRALRFLEKFSFHNAETPRVLFNNYFGDNLVTVISSKDGLRNFKDVSDEHIAWVKELVEKTGMLKRFKDSLFAKTLNEGMRFIKSKLDKENFELVNYFYEKAIKALSEKEFIFSFVNREFDHHELLRHKEKNLVIDWEHAREEFPPLFDVYGLLLSGGYLKGQDYVEMHVRSLEAILFGGNRKSSKIVFDFLREWGISREDAYYAFLFFLIDRLYLFLRMDSYRDGEIVTHFLKRMYDNESRYDKGWLI